MDSLRSGTNHAKPTSEASSSSSSSNEDFFQLEAAELNKSAEGVGNAASETSDCTLGNKHSMNTDVQNVDKIGPLGLPPRYGSSPPSEEFSRLSSVTQADIPFGGKPFSSDSCAVTQSPPIQMMGKLEAPDPNRIPSSIFVRTKSATPMDWSVASNESLFSIHVGNSSFSGDHALLLGQSGELNASLDQIFPGPNGSFPLPRAGDALRNSLDMHHEDSDMTEDAHGQAINDAQRVAVDEHFTRPPSSSGGTTPHSPTISRHSDGSGASIRSFAFPILTREGGRSVSVKVEKPPQQAQQQTPSHQRENVQQQEPTAQMTLNTGQARWFPCLSCCPFCC